MHKMLMPIPLSTLLAIVWAVTATPAGAALVHVPGDHPTIQDAIESALDGDVIVVAPGTYRDNLDFAGKQCTVRSSHGFDSTILIPLLSGTPTVKFVSGEGNRSVIEGFTIQGGPGSRGPGILCRDSSPAIQRNRITGFEAQSAMAAGIHIEGTSANPKIVECLVESNVGPGVAGSACGVVSLESCTILGNVADAGPALSVESCNGAVVKNTVVFGNAAFAHSTARFNQVARILIDHCTFDSNSSGTSGTLAFESCPNVVVSNSIVSRELRGAGIHWQGDGSIRALHNNIWSAPIGPCLGFTPGMGHLSKDPKYCDPGQVRFAVTDESPCVEAASDGTDIGAVQGGCEPVTSIEEPPAASDENPKLESDRISVGGGDAVSLPQEMPVVIHSEKPVYPEAARRDGVSGTVWIQALVDPDGRVRDARILKPSGKDAGFEAAALDAAYKCTYKPGIVNGRAKETWVSYKVDFKPEK